MAPAPLPQGGKGHGSFAPKAMTSKADPPRELKAQQCRCGERAWHAGEGRCGWCGKELRP